MTTLKSAKALRATEPCAGSTPVTLALVGTAFDERNYCLWSTTCIVRLLKNARYYGSSPLLLWFPYSVIMFQVVCCYVSSPLLLWFKLPIVMFPVLCYYISSPMFLWFKSSVIMVPVLCYCGSRPLLMWFPSSVIMFLVLTGNIFCQENKDGRLWFLILYTPWVA